MWKHHLLTVALKNLVILSVFQNIEEGVLLSRVTVRI